MSGSFEKAIKQLELFVRQLVKLNTPNAQGQTYRKTLENARRGAIKNGRTPEEIAVRFAELEPAPLEKGTEYVIGIFDDLSTTRTHTENGPTAITHVEMAAYCNNTGTDLDAWEVDALRVMDKAYLDEAYELRSKRNQNQGT